ncbi:hypothetical protein Pla86_50710 [Planctomycetes bacterium Pla86]|uniref:Uncharacterized protein n=1 Tax=Engelhardtia mirabilis TaxID=2528011 RepID=A0A518BSK3_9BACT|nr:hypothetical protein Pla133_50740 [Planctomycetes bacterium Pla133]QDV04276.1 hypothetical protein Pla86_50710 [Planctomycetes bacterium Pla86]
MRLGVLESQKHPLHRIGGEATAVAGAALLDCVLTDQNGGTVCVTTTQGVGNAFVQVGPCGGNSTATIVPSGSTRRAASDCLDNQYWLVKPVNGKTWGDAGCSDLEASVFDC